MKPIDRSWLAAAVAAFGVVLFAALSLWEAHSFRRAITDMVESETRVTVVNADGSVFYDTEAATGSHATRGEVQQAFAVGEDAC